MMNIIAYLDKNASAMIVILLILIAVELLIRLIQNRSKTHVNKNKITDGSNAFIQQMEDNTQEVFVLLDKKTQKPVFVSENCSSALGLPMESIKTDYRALFDVLDVQTTRDVKAELSEWDDEGVFSKEVLCTNVETKKETWSKLNVFQTKDKKYFFVWLQDYAVEKEIRTDLEKQIVQIQKEDDSKTVFLSKMSHEIRTPMNGVLGIIALAKGSAEQGDVSEVSQYLSQAENLSKFLLSIINDILDMTRIESGKLELEAASFDILDVAEKLRAMFETTVTDKGIKFELETIDFTKRFVIGDELRITQVITNFLSNSSKFTPAGGTISVTFRQMDIRDNKMSLMMKVRDTGKGMSKEFLHRIFKPFEQEDSGIARRFGGSGLGMSIADSLVAQMQGQLLVDSQEGKGSEFTVFLELPLAENQDVQNDKEAQNAKEVSLEGRRLLMAEDNDINAMVATRMLAKIGLEIEVASNGQLAVDKFKEHEAGYYDAILMDIQMPVMDGWEATKTIRKLNRVDAAVIPIFALSADAFVEDKRHSVEIGMNGHINKPIDYQELQVALKEALAE